MTRVEFSDLVEFHFRISRFVFNFYTKLTQSSEGIKLNRKTLARKCYLLLSGATFCHCLIFIIFLTIFEILNDFWKLHIILCNIIKNLQICFVKPWWFELWKLSQGEINIWNKTIKSTQTFKLKIKKQNHWKNV